MATTTDPSDIEPLVDNALDFLDRALEEIEEHPKYSVIHFYSAVELFVKARLMDEHWTLVVAKQKDLDLDKFIKGDFVSVSLDEAQERLKNVLQSPLTRKEYLAFDGLRRHRNRIVHFYHEATTDEGQRMEEIKAIVSEQLQAWYLLQKLLTEKWESVFSRWGEQLEEMPEKLRRHKDYFKPLYEELKPKIDKAIEKGTTFSGCPACGFEALEENDEVGGLYEGNCWVCEFQAGYLTIECDKCQRLVTFFSEGFGLCECGKYYEPNDLVEMLNEFVWQKDDPDNRLPAHCAFCGHPHTVIEYKGEPLCVGCFYAWNWEDIKQCDYCGDPNTGDMSDSMMHGCVLCDGNFGHLMSKDD